jgi:hypothetical protein
MKKAKSIQQTQAARFLEMARKTSAGKSGTEFQRETGKIALAQKSRKAARIG